MTLEIEFLQKHSFGNVIALKKDFTKRFNQDYEVKLNYPFIWFLLLSSSTNSQIPSLF